MSQLFECEVTLMLETGLHARPAGILVKTAAQFKSTIELHKNGQKKNAKSVMSLLSLGAQKGDVLKLTAVGEDAPQAGAEVQKLFLNQFHL